MFGQIPHGFRARVNSRPRSFLTCQESTLNRRRLRVEPLEDRRMLSLTLFVDAEAPVGGDGLGWSTAYNDLQAALEDAGTRNADAVGENDVEAIWIAEGVYRPSALLEADDPRSASFLLVDGVTLHGGFSGTETALEQRDWSAHVTTLSGDLGTLDDSSDNAYTVVYCGPDIEAAVDGVSIAGGKANGSSSSGHPERETGGGVYSSGILTVTNSTFLGNSAEYDGGGIYSSGTLTVANSTLSENLADDGSGGGISSFGTVTVTNSTLSDNSANDGGGICNYFGTVTVTDSTLSGNLANIGGGIYSYGTLTVTNSTFSANSAESGGGIWVYSYGTVTVTNSTLSGNSADNGGGGICIYGNSSTATLNNTLVAGNAACFGPDISHDPGSLSGSHNLIGDGADQSAFVDGEAGNQVGASDSPIDPFLSDWTELDSGQWGYCLLPGSPAIDAGENALAVDVAGQPLTEDLFGNARIQNETVDIGAVEGATVGRPGQVYVVTSLSMTVAEDGILTFLEAFEAANRNQPVGETPAGSFAEPDNIRFAEDLSGTILVDNGELVIHGDLSIEGPGAALLAFDAGGRSRVFLIQPRVSASLSGMTITGGFAVDGGAIYNNCGTLTVADSTLLHNSADDGYGGGISNCYGTLTVANSTLSGNSADDGSGGGISNSGTLTVTNSTLFDNSADDEGGGIYNNSNFGTVTVTDSTLSGNLANSGGGIYNYGTLTVTNSTLSENSADCSETDYASGGGIYNCFGSMVTVTDSMLLGNSADYGGGIRNDCGMITLNDSTLSGNLANIGGGIWAGNYDNWLAGTLNNTLVAGNTASIGRDIYQRSGTLSGSYSLIGDGSDQAALVDGENGNQVGTAETPIDARFVRNPSDGGDGWGDDPSTPDIDESANDDLGDLRLLPDSPAINAGDNALLPPDTHDLDADGDVTEPIPFDLDGNPRVMGGIVDIGAYEYVLPVMIAGDLNGDGEVGSSDLEILRMNWGQAVDRWSFIDGDASGDGKVTSEDLNIVRASWGETTAAAATRGAALPETTVGSQRRQPYFGPVEAPVTDLTRAHNTVFADLRALAEATWSDAIDGLRRHKNQPQTTTVDLAFLTWKS